MSSRWFLDDAKETLAVNNNNSDKLYFWILSAFIPFCQLRQLTSCVFFTSYVFPIFFLARERFSIYFTMFHPNCRPPIFSNNDFILNLRLVCSKPRDNLILYPEKPSCMKIEYSLNRIITKGKDFISCIAWVDAFVMCFLYISWGHISLISNIV